MTGLWAIVAVTRAAFAADSLYDAAVASDLAKVRALLAAHADLAEEGQLGTALHVAALKDNADVATLLLDQGADIEASTLDKAQRPLHVAAEHDSGAVARLLVARGAKLEVKDYRTRMPLLAARGADVNCRDKSGETPLARALWENSPATADLLRSLGGKE